MDDTSTNVLHLSDSWYDRLRILVQIWIPAIALFYVTIAALWDLPAAEQVTGTLAAIAVLIGTLLGISRKQYQKSDSRFDGTLEVNAGPTFDVDKYKLNVDGRLKDLAVKDEITLKIVSSQ